MRLHAIRFGRLAQLMLCAGTLMVPLAVFASAALADSVALTGTGTAGAGQKVTFTVQGEASSEGTIPAGGSPYEVRALMGTDECASDWLQTIGSNLVSLTGAEPLLRTSGGPFSQDVSATAQGAGTYHVCSYLLSTSHPVAVTLAAATSTLVISGGSTAKAPSRATLLRRALAKCKKIKKAKKRAACVKAARKRYGAKR